METPRHSAVGGLLDYTSEQPLAPGTLIRVPLGKRELPAVVWDAVPSGAVGDTELRAVASVLDAMPVLDADWRALVAFAAAYYQRGLGELALSVLPPELRKLDNTRLARRVKRLQAGCAAAPAEPPAAPAAPDLNAEQAAALQAIARARQPVLLHGVTGSGKTEVYLHAAEDALQRLRHWLLAHLGQADLVLGTRLAVFVPLPRLGLIVVDEEHDPSFKQQEGARYSARDLAVWRGHRQRVPVLLGSATPSLETWQRVQQGRYQRLALAERVGGGAMPRVRLVDMRQLPQTAEGTERVLAPALLSALQERLARGEQSLLLLNRRGYAPVLHCSACGWKSGCPHCSAWRVFHKQDRTLRCHHCGLSERVPRACPECGNLDIAPMGRGTEKLQEQLAVLLPQARVGRIDADTTRGVGMLQQQLQAVHAGEVDVLVGTQMVAKGHDFRRVTLVAAVNPDTALFSSDFRAPERLFALLMQAAGRAGRDAEQAARSEMWVQTWHPHHPVYAALRRHDYAAFAAAQLEERRGAGLPPFAALALVRADARSAETATAFLQEAAALARDLSGVTVYPVVPPHVAKVADVERMQMLLESSSRSALQAMLAGWLPQLDGLRGRHKGLLRWAVDVDPLVI